MNLAIHHLVVQMLFVLKEMEQEHVHVCQNISEILILDVDQNAFKIAIATDQRPVLQINAKTPAQEFVV